MERKETCGKCGKPNDRLPQRYCKVCHSAYMRKNRLRHSELSPEQRKKANARSYANNYLKRGYLTRKSCEVCSNEKSEMHHDNYDKPTDIRWFCRTHHLLHHKWIDTLKRFHEEPTCSTKRLKPVYDRVLVEVDFEWKEEHVTPSGAIGILFEDEIDRSMGSQTRGKVIEVPRGITPNHYVLKEVQETIQVGDWVYFHFNEIVKDTRVEINIYEKPKYLVEMENIFCIVRDGRIIMYGGRVLAEPIYDKEKIEPGILGEKTKSGIITSINGEKHNLKKARLAYIGNPLRNKTKTKAEPGDTIFYEKDADLEYEIEGKKYLCMIQDDLLMKEAA